MAQVFHSNPTFGVARPRNRLNGLRGRGPLRRFALAGLTAAFVFLAGLPVRGVGEQGSDDLDGLPASWELLKADPATRHLAQERAPGGARGNRLCERNVVAGPTGHSVLLGRPVARVAVLDELAVRLWVKASRPGVCLAVRVVLPRSRKDQSDTPATIIVRGASCDQANRWQQLELADVPKLLAGEVRVMRAISRTPIDHREAFVDSVVLAIPGDPGGVEVLTDELEVDGITLSRVDHQMRPASFPAPRDTISQASQVAAVGPHDDSGVAAGYSSSATARVRLQGTSLNVDGRPFLPRVISWNGEPFQFLAERRFNVIQLAQLPTEAQVAEAERHGLWFICSPPRPEALARATLGQATDRVVAWVLHDEAMQSDPEYARRWAELVRARDAVANRPIILGPDAEWPSAVRTADVLALKQSRVGQLSAADFDEWIDHRSAVATPGMPIWAVFATQFSESTGQQVALLSGKSMPPPAPDEEQLEAQVRVACTRGIRGFVFQSTTSLSATNDATCRRAAIMERINRKLQRIEPWLAGGQVVNRCSSTDGAFTGVLLHVDRARLLIVSKISATAPATRAEFVVPGIPDASHALLLAPAAIRTVAMQRVAGGARIVLDSADDDLIVITEDPQAIQSVRQSVTRDGPQAARLELDLARQNAATVEATTRRLEEIGFRDDQTLSIVTRVSTQLRQCDALLAARRIDEAYQLAASANRALHHVMRAQQYSVSPLSELDSNPLALSYGRLPDRRNFVMSLDSWQRGENLLYGGNFEDLQRLIQFGWKHINHDSTGVDTHAKLSADQPRHGRHSLELHAHPATPNSASSAVAGPHVWISSPAIPIDEGQLIEITGWVHVDEPIMGSVDGLQIVDSLGGPELSLAVRQTSGWQPFRMIRAVPEPAELRLTFALTGYGSAKVDSVMVRALTRPTARRLPPVDTPANPQAAGKIELPARLLVAPRP